MKILVTGANGFIGSTIVERLISEGHSVRCLVHRNLTWLKGLAVELVYGSVTRKETLKEAVKEVDFIFHMAGVLRVVKEETFYAVNQIGTKNLIEAVYENNPGIKRFVYVSSQAAMGPSQTCAPQSISAGCNPVSHYGKSKLKGEEEVLKFKDKLPVMILRPSAVYGPRDKDLFPFFKLASMGIFPILTGNPECYVQLLLVDDFAEICSMIARGKDLKNNIYFLAGEKAYQWKEVGEIIGSVTGKKASILVLPMWLIKTIAFLSEEIMALLGKTAALNRDKIREFCQRYWMGDVKSTEDDFGYKFTKLENGARITYNWYLKNKWL